MEYFGQKFQREARWIWVRTTGTSPEDRGARVAAHRDMVAVSWRDRKDIIVTSCGPRVGSYRLRSSFIATALEDRPTIEGTQYGIWYLSIPGSWRKYRITAGAPTEDR